MPSVKDMVYDTTAPMGDALAAALSEVLPTYGIHDESIAVAVMKRFGEEWTRRFEQRRAMNDLLQPPPPAATS